MTARQLPSIDFPTHPPCLSREGRGGVRLQQVETIIFCESYVCPSREGAGGLFCSGSRRMLRTIEVHLIFF